LQDILSITRLSPIFLDAVDFLEHYCRIHNMLGIYLTTKGPTDFDLLLGAFCLLRAFILSKML